MDADRPAAGGGGWVSARVPPVTVTPRVKPSAVERVRFPLRDLVRLIDPVSEPEPPKAQSLVAFTVTSDGGAFRRR